MTARSSAIAPWPSRPVADAGPEPPLPNIRVRRYQQQQASRREAEQQVRRRVVAIAAGCRRHATHRQIAQAVGVSERTLRAWRARAQTRPAPRGRPPVAAPLPQRQPILRFLRDVTGPAAGLPMLRAHFPQVPRCVLAELLQRFRRVWRHRLRRPSFRLDWHRPGRVWAMDHSEATQLIDGQYDQIFAVRDLASHTQLAWCGVRSTDADTTGRILESLLIEHGPPLVIKSDQGSPFVSTLMRDLLARWRITPLFSPKRRPRYNGALERANSTHKTYTHRGAVRAGHPCFWTSQDLDAARQLANRITRPWGHTGVSPEAAWRARTTITSAERDQFAQEVAEQERVARGELGLAQASTPTARQQDRLARRAVSGALERLGYLTKRSLLRAPPMPKRLGHVSLQRALKAQREAPPVDLLSGDDTGMNMKEILASMNPHDTIRSGTRAASSVSTPPRAPPTHGESEHHSFWRHALTLVIRLAKAAKIMR